jgi:hypothetical protein
MEVGLGFEAMAFKRSNIMCFSCLLLCRIPVKKLTKKAHT